MDNYYEEYLFRSSEALLIMRESVAARLAQVCNVSGLHSERAELRERITAIDTILAERELF